MFEVHEDEQYSNARTCVEAKYDTHSTLCEHVDRIEIETIRANQRVRRGEGSFEPLRWETVKR